VYPAMKISESEGKVLEALWRADGPASAEDVVAMIGEDCGWSAGTIRTFLTRLVKKKAVAAKPDGRRYLYRPLIAREDYVLDESRQLIDRLFGGRIAPFITQFSDRRSLSRDEIEELKRLIERLDRDR
jgi:predicted transcriptional regulator